MYWLPAILILPYLIVLLKCYRSLLLLETFKITNDPSTFVSVVIACRNEQKNLPVLLKNICLQNYPKHLFEVIIVNDCSTDNTSEVSSLFTENSNFRTLDNKGSGKKQALRTGIREAKGNLIITTDADCRMGKDWIRTIAAFYEINRPDMIICPVRLDSSHGLFGRFQELEFMGLQGITAGTAISEEATMCNGANLAFTREAYLNHSDNLHDEINSGDDIFLLHSLKKDSFSNIAWLESPDAMVTTETCPSLKSFLKQRSRWILKGRSYSDKDTFFAGSVVFIAVILQIYYLVVFAVYLDLMPVFALILFLKSVPDFLILKNTSRRYGRKDLMRWFFPSQLIYPVYVITVVFYSLICLKKYKSVPHFG